MRRGMIDRNKLWFDVGIKRYTTQSFIDDCNRVLWFDVGIKRYTTTYNFCTRTRRCGLM